MLKQANSSRAPQKVTQISSLRSAALIYQVPVKGPRQLINSRRQLPHAACRHKWQRTFTALSRTAAPTCQSGLVCADFLLLSLVCTPEACVDMLKMLDVTMPFYHGCAGGGRRGCGGSPGSPGGSLGIRGWAGCRQRDRQRAGRHSRRQRQAQTATDCGRRQCADAPGCSCRQRAATQQETKAICGRKLQQTLVCGSRGATCPSSLDS